MRAPCDLRYTSVTAYLLRDWVEPELRALDRLLSPGQVFVDIGANVGLYALKGARLVGRHGRVIAMEPGASARAQLEANLALNNFSWVDVIAKAAADVNGRATLHHVALGDDPQAFSLIENLSARGRGEIVETVRLDSLVESLGLERLDLIKIDVEGAEAMVLRGAGETLSRFRPAVIFECNAYASARAATADAWAALQGLGYGFRRAVRGDFVPVEELPSDFCNLLAVHPQ